MRVTREKLYEEVWAEPMTTVAARYKVSSSFLARVCERLKLPRPSRGYWARLEVGRASPRPDLPEAQLGDDLEWSQEGTPRRQRGLPKPPAERLSRPASERPIQHALLVGARHHFEVGRVSRNDYYLKPSKKLLVDLLVSKDALSRALDTANELFLSLEDRGHRVLIAPNHEYGRLPLDQREKKQRTEPWDTWSPMRPTVVFVGTVAIGLTLYELSELATVRRHDGRYVRVTAIPQGKRVRAVASEWTHEHDMPSGRLALRAYCPYRVASWETDWREAKSGELPGRIGDIVAPLERATLGGPAAGGRTAGSGAASATGDQGQPEAPAVAHRVVGARLQRRGVLREGGPGCRRAGRGRTRCGPGASGPRSPALREHRGPGALQLLEGPRGALRRPSPSW